MIKKLYVLLTPASNSTKASAPILAYSALHFSSWKGCCKFRNFCLQDYFHFYSSALRHSCLLLQSQLVELFSAYLQLEKHPRNYPMAAILEWHQNHRYANSFIKIWILAPFSLFWICISYFSSQIHIRQCGVVASIAALDPGGPGSNPTIVKNPFSPSNLEEGTQKSVIRMPFQYGRHWIVGWMLF